MKFRVGCHTYTLAIVSRPAGDFDPALFRAFCDEAARMIYISAKEPINERSTLLRHEHAHAFEYAFGPPSDHPEHRANWVANVAECLERDIAAQGGWGRLATMMPEDDEPAPPAPPAHEPGELRHVPIEQEEGPPCVDEDGVGVPAYAAAGQAVAQQWQRRADPRATTSTSRTVAAPPGDFRAVRYCGKCERPVLAGAIVDGPVVRSPHGEHVDYRERILYCGTCHHLQQWLEAVELDGRNSGVPLTPEPRYHTGELVDRWLTKHPQARPPEL